MSGGAQTTNPDVPTFPLEIDADISDSLIPFPIKLFTLLKQNHGEIVYWLDHGLAFRVGDNRKFSAEIMPKFFKRTILYNVPFHVLIVSLITIDHIE